MPSSNRTRIGVIVDRMTVTRWQEEALRSLADDHEFLIYNCRNTRPGRRQLRHALYYFLNLVTIRNPLTRHVPLPAGLQAAVRNFDAEYEGAWQRLPGELLDEIGRDRPAAIIKFGMGLLRIPPGEQFDIPILSYHHGDPDCFRGRPAGFYEMFGGAPVMGQVVQRLSNKLDAGDILAAAETKVLPHSYRATLIEAYRHSPLILRTALRTLAAGQSRAPGHAGKNYRLPGNGLVAWFVLKQWRNAVSRLIYGLFKEKLWTVATVNVGDAVGLELIEQALARQADWRWIPVPAGYRFLADPFFHPEVGLLVEALNRRTHRGEIVHLPDGPGAGRRLSGSGGHYSYPAAVMENRKWYVVPEISDWSPARAFPLEGDALGDGVELRISRESIAPRSHALRTRGDHLFVRQRGSGRRLGPPLVVRSGSPQPVHRASRKPDPDLT